MIKKYETEIFYNIFKKYNIELWGVCDFELIKNNLISCRNIRKIFVNSKSIITFAFPYKNDVKERNISYYAVGPDYHEKILNILNKICKDLKKIFVNYNFICFCDNSPIPEVLAACYSGLGVIGKNNLLINDKYGSWVFLAEIVTDFKINNKNFNLKYCNNCNFCIKNCPSKALNINKFDKDSCISCISQKKKLSLKEENLFKKGKLIWGCDICQEICPMNKNKVINTFPVLKEPAVPCININNYNLYKDRAFLWRGESIIKRNIEIFNFLKK